MKRISSQPRPDFRARVQSQGLLWDETDSGPYWNESAAYELTADEVDRLERASNELHAMCLEAAEYVIRNQAYDQFGIDALGHQLIRKSWDAGPPSIYGRFDLALRDNEIKLLEYNADTPTGLLEAAVIQWYWLQDTRPEMDQFNSIHERLVSKWEEMRPFLNGNFVHLTSLDNLEDSFTIAYMEDVLRQAGYETRSLAVRQLGLDTRTSRYGDEQDREILNLFKLYPWEWMIRESGAAGLMDAHVCWIEPAWKMLLSNKAILKVLWDLFPGHPYLLRTRYSAPQGDCVRKPKLGREGRGISVRRNGVEYAADPSPYGSEGVVYQEYFDLPEYDSRRPVIGSWIIGHEENNCSAGIGIRETTGFVTNNASQFVPHYFAPRQSYLAAFHLACSPGSASKRMNNPPTTLRA
jgi:glutathionylspermidine synthase